jgi:hypothetical protein
MSVTLSTPLSATTVTQSVELTSSTNVVHVLEGEPITTMETFSTIDVANVTTASLTDETTFFPADPFNIITSLAVDENILVLEMTTDTPDDIFDLVDDDMEYSGSGDFITADVNSISNESEKDLFFTVPLVSETSTSKTVDKTVTKAKMLDIETDTNVTCDESGFCSDPMPTDISLEDFFGFDTMTKLQNTGLNSIFVPANM